MKDPASVLNFYRNLIALRNNNPVLQSGSYEMLLPEHEQIYAFRRTLGSVCVEVYCNFSDRSAFVQIPEGKMILQEELHQNFLNPYGFCVIERSILL